MVRACAAGRVVDVHEHVHLRAFVNGQPVLWLFAARRAVDTVTGRRVNLDGVLSRGLVQLDRSGVYVPTGRGVRMLTGNWYVPLVGERRPRCARSVTRRGLAA